MDVLDVWYSAPNGDDLQKAIKDMKEERALAEVKSAIIDPTNMIGVYGLRSKPSAVQYQTLRRMAQVPAISAIINTRLNQIARFSRRARFDGDLGFKIVAKDRRKKMTEAQQKRAMEIEDFFLGTGGAHNPKRKDNFNQFLRKVVRDSLVLDSMVWENVPNSKGELAELWAVDASTIEIVAYAPTSEMYTIPEYDPMTPKGQKIRGEIAYVQRVSGIIVAEYTEDELAYAIRNPRTDLNHADFGLSELETLIEIVTGIMNGVRYNTSYFSHSHLPQGVLEIVGKYKDQHLEAFKRHWRNLTQGAQGKWSVPVLALEDGQGFKFTPFKNSNKDMEFNQFLEFLFNVACAVYQIDPNEVGFKSWTSGQSMTASDNTSAKMEGSKDKGLIPLMHFLSDTFNSEIVKQLDPDFEFQWVGVDEENEDAKWQRITSKLNAGIMTVAEVRKEEDMEDILAEDGKPAKWTEAPANPQLLQVFMNELQQEQAKEQQAQQQEQTESQQAQGQEQQQAEAEAQQAQADDAHAKQMEVMQAQQKHEMSMDEAKRKHEQLMAQKKAEHEMNKMQSNNSDQQKPKAKDKPTASKATPPAKQSSARPKNKIQKSITEDEIEIVIDWKY